MTDRAPPLTPDEIALLEHDIPCQVCQYNLRHQPPTGLCPECATRVERSLRADTLRAADPSWLVSIARGGGALFCSSVLGVAHVALYLLSFQFASLYWIWVAFALPIYIVQLPVAIIGGLLIAKTQPATPTTPRVTRRLWRLRLAAVLALGSGWLTYLIAYGVTPVGAPYYGITLLAMYISIPICNFLVTSQQIRVARRVPDPGLAAAYSWLRWVAVAVAITAIVTSFLRQLRSAGYPLAAISSGSSTLVLDMISAHYNLRFATALRRIASARLDNTHKLAQPSSP